MFEDQMRALEQQQAQELLSIPLDGSNGSLQHLAVSAPTTPPRVNSALSGEISPHTRLMDPAALSSAVGKADKRKSVAYAVTNTAEFEAIQAEVAANNVQSSFSRSIGAKSMPASRRTSASEHDEDLASHLQGLSMTDKIDSPYATTAPQLIKKANGATFPVINESNRFVTNGTSYNAGILLDEQIDKEMHSE